MALNLVTGFANANHIRAVDDGSMNADIFGPGDYVLNRGRKLEAQFINTNTLRIYDGDIMMQGRLIRIDPDTYQDLTISAGTAGKKRIDVVVARYTKSASTGVETVALAVLKGTATSGSPVAKTPTAGNVLDGVATTHEMALYRIYIDGTSIGAPEQLFSTDSRIDALETGKAPMLHTHTKEQITDFPTSLPASDVPDWAKQPQKPSYTPAEIGGGVCRISEYVISGDDLATSSDGKLNTIIQLRPEDRGSTPSFATLGGYAYSSYYGDELCQVNYYKAYTLASGQAYKGIGHQVGVSSTSGAAELNYYLEDGQMHLYIPRGFTTLQTYSLLLFFREVTV